MTQQPTTRVPARQPAGTRRGPWTSPAAAVRAVRPGHTECAARCGWPLHPDARAGPDGQPDHYDRHPGCDTAPPAPQQRVTPGGSTNRPAA